MTRYLGSLDEITADRLTGFFVGWPNPPSPETHLRLLQGSDEVVLAVDDESSRVIGFITAITDGVLSAYIPFLEVLPEHQGRGIGQELVRRMMEKLAGLYMVDIVCDPGLTPFYRRVGMIPGSSMMLRRYEHQSGEWKSVLHPECGGLTSPRFRSARSPCITGVSSHTSEKRRRAAALHNFQAYFTA